MGIVSYFQFVLCTLVSMSLPCDETPCWICDKFSGMAIVAAEAAAVC